MYKPGDAVTLEFVTSAAGGAATDADSTPTGKLAKNGIDDGTVNVTITSLGAGTGRYKAAFTIPNTYSATNDVDLTIFATIGGVAAANTILHDKLDNKRFADFTYTTAGYMSVDLVTWNSQSIPNVNQAKGAIYAVDSSGNDLATASAQSTMQTSVNNLNNLSALAVLYGPTTMEVPSAGSIAYAFTLLVKDAEGHLLDLSASPTVTAANAAGIDRSANLSAVTHAGTGQYTFTYTVASTAAQEGLSIKAAGTASSDSTSRIAYCNPAAVATDTTTTLAAIKAKTDLIATNSADSPELVTALGTISTNLDATVSSRLATAGYTAPHNTNIDSAATVAGQLSTMLVTSGPNYTYTADALKNAPAGGGGGGFTGSNQVTIILHDAAGNPVANTIFSVSGTGTAATDGTGQKTVGLNSGTYTVTVSPQSQVIWTPTPITVTGNQTFTLTGTANTLPSPPAGNQTTAYAFLYDGGGNLIQGRRFQLHMVKSNAGVNLWNASPIESSLSDSTGRADLFAQLGGTYQASVDGETWGPQFTIPTNAGTTFNVSEWVSPFN